MRTKKVATVVAGFGAGALGLSLIGLGTGLGAQFTDGAAANAHLAVGTFGCALSSSDNDVTISNGGHTANVTFPTINSSVPSSDSAPLTVTNSGTIPLVVNWTVTTSGHVFDSGHVSALPVTSGLAINSGNARTYSIGFQWGELQNADLGKTGTATYTASCVEPQSVNPNFTLWQQDGGTASYANGAVTLTMPSSPSTAGAGVELSNVPAKLPADAPTFSTDNYAAGSPRWYIQFTSGDYLFGYPSNAPAGVSGMWSEVTSAHPNSYVPWSQVVTDYGTQQVSSVEIVMDMDQPSTTDTISCIDYGPTQQLGSTTPCS